MQHISFWISGNRITSHQLFTNCTGCQFRPAYSSSSVHSCYGIHNSQCLAYLSDAVQSVATTSTREGLRSAAASNYVTPRLQSKFRKRAFSHAGGPAAWNRLPETIHQPQAQTHFKKLFKTFLSAKFLWMFLTVMSAVLVSYKWT